MGRVARALAHLAIPAVICIGGATGVNFYFHHNVSYEDSNRRVFMKADGVMAYTEITISNDGEIEVRRAHAGNYRSYTDEDGDGDVDRVYKGSKPLIRGSHSRSFYRDKHLCQFPDVFREADQDFRKQMKRFKPFMNR